MSRSRSHELDALRGGLLVVMALTHLPTRFSLYADQPLGFVSTAEGFIFLSAFLVGRGYSRLHQQGRFAEMRRKAWQRARRLYYWHIGMLGLVLTLGAGFALLTGRSGLKNLLSGFFAEPLPAMLGSVVMAYQPPLFDILPMYIVFLAVTPAILQGSRREGWGKVLLLSFLLWLFAQVGGRALLFGSFVSLTGWPMGFESLGAFDWFAWQIVWVAGLAVGLNSAAVQSALAGPEGRRRRVALLAGAAMLACLFLFWRHLGPRGAGELWISLNAFDKWRMGFLRVVNFAAVAFIASCWLVPLLKSARFGWLAQLGGASLHVFCAHVAACVVCVALISQESLRTSLRYELLMIVGTFAAMFVVAARANASRIASAVAPRARLGSNQNVA